MLKCLLCTMHAKIVHEDHCFSVSKLLSQLINEELELVDIHRTVKTSMQ